MFDISDDNLHKHVNSFLDEFIVFLFEFASGETRENGHNPKFINKYTINQLSIIQHPFPYGIISSLFPIQDKLQFCILKLSRTPL